MPDWIPQLIPQFGALIIFIWYLRDASARDEQARAKADDLRAAATEKNHAEWRVFIREQQDASNKAIARISEEVKRNTELISAVSASLIAHDVRSAEALEDIRRIRDRLAQARIGHVEDSPLPKGRSE